MANITQYGRRCWFTSSKIIEAFSTLNVHNIFYLPLLIG